MTEKFQTQLDELASQNVYPERYHKPAELAVAQVVELKPEVAAIVA